MCTSCAIPGHEGTEQQCDSTQNPLLQSVAALHFAPSGAPDGVHCPKLSQPPPSQAVPRPAGE
jgi:hypothetical protein